MLSLKQINQQKLKMLELKNQIQLMLSNEADRKKVLDCMKEMSNSMTRIDAERDFQKEAANALADDVAIDKKYINALAKIYHKQNFAQFQQQKEEIEDLYESIVK
jgi:hypothetical protein